LSSEVLDPLALKKRNVLDMPDPSPSFKKKAFDVGDHESIAGGSSLGPFH
jgi:hypothetical protein